MYVRMRLAPISKLASDSVDFDNFFTGRKVKYIRHAFTCAILYASQAHAPHGQCTDLRTRPPSTLVCT